MKTNLLSILSYSIGTEASHLLLCPLSFRGTPEGAEHIFDSLVALQAVPVYSLPEKTKEPLKKTYIYIYSLWIYAFKLAFIYPDAKESRQMMFYNKT